VLMDVSSRPVLWQNDYGDSKEQGLYRGSYWRSIDYCLSLIVDARGVHVGVYTLWRQPQAVVIRQV